MAKMFYSIDEAAERLQKTPDEVKQMVTRGELTELQQDGEPRFKVDQIELLAPEDETSSVGDLSSAINLSDSGGGSALGLADSAGGSAFGLADSAFDEPAPVAPAGEDEKERTGISVFDAEDIGLEEEDAAAQTQIEDIQGGGFDLDDETLDNFGSGSGLMDLTQESDDTALGAESLLDDLGPIGDVDPLEASAPAGALFEEEDSSAADDMLVADAAQPTAAVEIYDGAGSGLTGGASLVAVLGIMLAIAVLVMSMVGMPVEFLSFSDMAPLIIGGGLAALAVIVGVIAMVVGGKG